MSNRVDFYQSEKSELSIAAGRAEVFYDGSLCSQLELVEIVRAGFPEFSRAKLTSNDSSFEPQAGKSICIKYLYDEWTSVGSVPIFIGRIEKIESRLDADGWSIEITARDFSCELERITVYGRHIAKDDGTVMFLGGADTTFNEAAEPNAGVQMVLHNGRSVRLFAGESSNSRFFSCAEVIDYLLTVYLPAGMLQCQPIERLEALTQGQIVYDLDATGLNLLEALQRCCERAGIKFKFTPSMTETGPAQQIIFYKDGKGKTVELNCQRASEALSISGTNVAELTSRKNQLVSNRYIGRGDFKIFEATFELVKGWDASLEETNYDKFSPSTNPDFIEVKDVYRRWVLNEAGDYTKEPYNQGEAYDFSLVFGSDDYVSKNRRFWPALSCDKQGKSMGYFLEVTYNDGEHWLQYLGAFENRLDECGIWLSSDRLDIFTYIAALKGILKFRITASVVSDERLSFKITDGPVNSVVPVVDRVFTLPRQFKYRKVTGKSIFANSQSEALGEADEADDSEALREFIRRQAAGSAEPTESFEVKTLQLSLGYGPGDAIVSSPESRDLFGLKTDNRSRAWIERVQMDFENQVTKLIIKKQRRGLL